MCHLAAELEEAGQFEAAVEMYRVAMAAAGPSPEVCFQVAELLYRLGDLPPPGTLLMAVELDEDYVEARANLGCVLAETGQRELAVAAFEGALVSPGYADAHYHLARTLDDMGRRGEAEEHWRLFLAMAPDSPWAAGCSHPPGAVVAADAQVAGGGDSRSLNDPVLGDLRPQQRLQLGGLRRLLQGRQRQHSGKPRGPVKQRAGSRRGNG